VLDSLITSKTRVKLLLKFFLNGETQGYLRGLADELHESTNAVRVELNRLTDAGLLETSSEGRIKLYRANKKHKLFPDLQNLVKKNLGLDQLVDNIIHKLGDVRRAYLTGDYAQGTDSGIVDMVLVGNVNHEYLHYLVTQAEHIIKKKIRVLVVREDELPELADRLKLDRSVVLWETEQTTKETGNE